MNPASLITRTLLGTLSGVLLGLTLTGPSSLAAAATQEPTQETKAGQAELNKRFEKARLLERVERNPKAAAEIYRALAGTAGASTEFKDRCWLRLGVCLDQLGQKKEARLAYSKVSKNGTRASTEAKARLQGKSRQHLRMRVLLQIGKLIDGKELEAAKRDLLWIGEDSVPYLIQAIESEKLNLDFVVRATGILLALGGPDAIAFIRASATNEDTLLRRALVRGFTSKVGPELAKAMALFLKDPDARTREEALRRIINIIPTSTILDFLEAGPDSLRDYVLTRFRPRKYIEVQETAPTGCWIWDFQDPQANKNADRLLGLFRLWYSEAHPNVISKQSNKYCIQVWNNWPLWSELLRRPQGFSTLALVVRKANSPFQLPIQLFWSKETVPSPTWILELARSLPPSSPKQLRERDAYSRAPTLGQSWLLSQLSVWISGSSEPLLGPDFMDVVPELASLHYDLWGMLSQAVRELAQPKDLRMVVELIPKLYNTYHFDWISKQTASLDLLPVYQKSLAYIWEQRKNENHPFSDGVVILLYKSLLRQQDPAIGAFLVEEAAEHTFLYPLIANGILAWKKPDTKLLKKLLVTPAAPQEGAANEARGRLLIRLAKAGSKDMGKAFGRADGFGLVIYASAYSGGIRSESSLGWLLAQAPKAKPGTYLHDYSAKDLGKIVQDCLSVGAKASWQNIQNMLNKRAQFASGQPGMSPYIITDPVLSGIVQVLPKAPSDIQSYIVYLLTRNKVEDYPSIRTLYLWLANSENPRYQAMALERMQERDFPDIAERLLVALDSKSSEVQNSALRRLGQLRYAASFGKVRALLASANSGIRSTTVDALVAIDRRRGLEAVLPMIRDESYYVRLRVIAVCRSSLDPSVTGTLLIGLQDSEKKVRKAAQEALDAIRFYHEQKSFWAAWKKRSKLGYSSPSTALLEQAQADQPQKIRLQAIRSLGTLADPGSLPFLIHLMKDKDPAIQKAAEESLNRINAKKR